MAFYPLLIHRLLLPVCCFRRGSVVLVGVPRYVLVTSSLMSPMVPAVLAYADCILVQPIFPFQHVDRVMFKWCSSVLHDLGDRVLTAFFMHSIRWCGESSHEQLQPRCDVLACCITDVIQLAVLATRNGSQRR